MTNPISQYGIAVSPPRGWEAIIYRRVPGPGETSQAVLHAANFILPPERGDYGSGAVERMTTGDVFCSLMEFDSASAGKALFATNRRPQQMATRDFSPNALQRSLPGQAGVQRFFAESGRAFCLYVVVAGFNRLAALAPSVNQFIQALQITTTGG